MRNNMTGCTVRYRRDGTASVRRGFRECEKSFRGLDPHRPLRSARLKPAGSVPISSMPTSASMRRHASDDSEPHFTVPHAPVSHSSAATQAIATAVTRVEQALRSGRLLTPFEAMALAGPEARSKETLFSIARAVAWTTNTDQDEILTELGERFPDFK